MNMSKLCYFSEFLLFPPLFVFAMLLAFRRSIPPHPVIWATVYVVGLVGWTLIEYLRSRRTIRRSQRVDPNGLKRGQIKDLVSIRARPAAVEDRAVPGHWEGDLLSGSRNSYIATLVERHTRYVMLAKVANK